VLNDLPTLVWAANLVDLELHTFLHKAPAIARPTALAFDLDPGSPANIGGLLSSRAVAKTPSTLLACNASPKTSGSKGLQVYVPLNTSLTYKRTKALARALAEFLERRFPDTVVSRMQKSLRTGKVLVDWSQNDDHKTTVNAYSLRAKQRPTVSTPVTWDEVAGTLKKGDSTLLTFEFEEVIERIAERDDLFAPVIELRQKLPPLETLKHLSA
jgi:bifunctional non-homologous end joining protein LigD